MKTVGYVDVSVEDETGTAGGLAASTPPPAVEKTSMGIGVKVLIPGGGRSSGSALRKKVWNKCFNVLLGVFKYLTVAVSVAHVVAGIFLIDACFTAAYDYLFGVAQPYGSMSFAVTVLCLGIMCCIGGIGTVLAIVEEAVPVLAASGGLFLWSACYYVLRKVVFTITPIVDQYFDREQGIWRATQQVVQQVIQQVASTATTLVDASVPVTTMPPATSCNSKSFMVLTYRVINALGTLPSKYWEAGKQSVQDRYAKWRTPPAYNSEDVRHFGYQSYYFSYFNMVQLGLIIITALLILKKQ